MKLFIKNYLKKKVNVLRAIVRRSSVRGVTLMRSGLSSHS